MSYTFRRHASKKNIDKNIILWYTIITVKKKKRGKQK